MEIRCENNMFKCIFINSSNFRKYSFKKIFKEGNIENV